VSPRRVQSESRCDMWSPEICGGQRVTSIGINQAVVLDATYRSQLKRSQKRHQRRVIPPVSFRLVCIGNFTRCQGLGFHLQIGFCVDIGRVERNMPEPRANGVDVHAGAE